MAVRELINRHSKFTSIAAVVMLLAVVMILWLYVLGGTNQPVSASLPAREFYSVDNGMTYFADASDRRVPFEHEGKPAYRASVVQCGQGKPVVQYLSRYTIEALKELDKLNAEKPAGWTSDVERLRREGIEYSKPGGNQWVQFNSPQLMQVLAGFPCPDGKQPQPVIPE